jgi:hypothetical protein
MHLYSHRPINLAECRRLGRWLRTGNFAEVARQEQVTAPAVKRMVGRAIHRILDHSDHHDNEMAREFPLIWAMDHKDELLQYLHRVRCTLAADESGRKNSLGAVRKMRAQQSTSS